MKLVWTEQAVRDLVELRAYIETDNPGAAADIAKRILQSTGRLLRHPEVGRPGRLRGTRELVIARTRYFIPYRIQRDRIELLRVIHGRRVYPIARR